MLILAAINATWLHLILIVQTSKRLTPCHQRLLSILECKDSAWHVDLVFLYNK